VSRIPSRILSKALTVGLIGTAVATPGARAAIAGVANGAATSPAMTARRCTLAPGGVRAVLTVLRDTSLPFAASAQRALSYSAPAGMADSMLPTADTPMPAARVRLLRLDSATRAAFTAAGIVDPQPEAFIRAAPYRADCRTIKWTDSRPWTQTGDTGYVVATLAPRELWIGDRPVLVIPDVWSYPYPRYPGPSLYPPAQPPLASADALFSYQDWMLRGRGGNVYASLPQDSSRLLSIAWAQANMAERERDPIRSEIRQAILNGDFARARETPSRFRGTYRVELQSGDRTVAWQFRTVDRPAYRWLDVDTARTIAALIASPHVDGYRLVGYAADSAGAVPEMAPRTAAMRSLLMWLAVADRSTVAGSDTVRAVTGMLEFVRKVAPLEIWSALDAYVPPPDPIAGEMMARMRITRTAGDDQPRLPLTLRVGPDGRASADTTLVRAGQRLRVRLRQLDTVSVRRPF